MVIVKNRIIPLDGYKAMTVWPFIFVRKEIDGETINHEMIHGRQQVEMLLVPFFIWYVAEWLIRLVFGHGNAYHNIGFEREAFANEWDDEYLENRRAYAWWKYMLNKKK